MPLSKQPFQILIYQNYLKFKIFKVFETTLYNISVQNLIFIPIFKGQVFKQEICLFIFCYFTCQTYYYKHLLPKIFLMIEQEPRLTKNSNKQELNKIHIKSKSVRSQKNVQKNQQHQQSLSSLSSNTRKHKIPQIVLRYIIQQAKESRQIPNSPSPSNSNTKSNPAKFMKLAAKISQNKNMAKYNTQKCEICSLDVPEMQKSSMAGCEHKYCDNCLQQYVIFKISKFEVVQCPAQDCKKVLNQKSRCYISLPLDARKKYKKIKQYAQMLKNPNLKLCPNQNCEGFLETLPSPQPGVLRIINPQCNSCHKFYCSNCMFEQHQGDCDPHQINFFQKTLHYRQCNRCKTVIDKSAGCNHMTCRCGYQFCYICGGHWTSSHQCNNPDQQPLFNETCECCCLHCDLSCCECCECCDACCNSFQNCMGQICSAICDGCLQPCCQSIQECCDRCGCCAYLQQCGCCNIIAKIGFFLLCVLIIAPAIYIQLALLILFRFLAGIFIGLFGFPCLLSQYQIQYEWYHILIGILLLPITILFLMGLGLRFMFQNQGAEQIVELLCLPCAIWGQV